MKFLHPMVALAGGAAALLVWCAPAFAQPRTGPSATTVVNADRTVTFRFKAPQAANLVVHLQTRPDNTTVTLKKDDAGVWSGTTPGALAPGAYLYYLQMDQLDLYDPAARRIRGTQGPKWSCLLEVPGNPPEDFEFAPDIPHGAVTHEWVRSTVIGETLGLNVYTPPGYLTSTQSYPVLYLLHGGFGDEDTWIKLGYIDRLLDRWIAQGAIREIVVVMTSNRVDLGESAGISPVLNDYFAKDVMPHVERRYRVQRDRACTAVAGFSMGGRQTLSLALGLPEKFGALACLSGALGRENTRPATELFPILADAQKFNRLFPVWHLAWGEQDASVAMARKFHEELTRAGIQHTFTTGPGDHAMKTDWNMLRDFLREFTKAP